MITSVILLLFYTLLEVSTKFGMESPKPFDLERTENWINKQVAKSIKMLQEIEKMKGRDFVQQLLAGTVLNEKHRKIVAQVTRELE